MKNRITFSALCLLLLTLSCNCPDCTTPPEPVAFRIVDYPDSTDLIFTGRFSADSIAIFYLENNIRKDVEFKIVTDSINNRAIIYSLEIGWISAAGVKEYFLYLNHLETDSVYLNFEENSDRCCTSFTNKDFSINGTVLKRDRVDFLFYYFK